MSNDNRTNLQASHGAHNRKQTHKRSLLLSFIVFMAWVVAIGLLLAFIGYALDRSKPIATDTNNGYDGVLSKLNSDLPSRKLLAFFMFDTSAAPQAVTTQSSIALTAHTSATRAQTIIPIAMHLLTDYDGLTLQNRIAVRQICRAVTVKTESKTRHPISLWYSVALTQKLTGVIHHG